MLHIIHVHSNEHNIISLAEIPECHLKIASNKAVLKQLVVMMSCSNYTQIAGMISMGGMLCLSHR